MSYNLTNISSANNMLDLSTAVNTAVGGMFFPVMLGILYVVLIMNTMQYGGTNSFFTSSFVVFVLAGMLWGVGLLAETYLIISFALFVVSALAFTALR